MPIKIGDEIELTYIGKLEDGTIFDKVDEKNPVKFRVGKGEIIKGLDKAVIGMEKGERKQIKVISRDAYGKMDPKLIKKLDRSIFPNDIKEDLVCFIKDNRGVEVPGRIIKIIEDKVVIDLNHPLAGKTLNFIIKIIDII